jgi:putative SOS response-associated peptidase YedK
MPHLYRCRTSLGEAAALFQATPPPRARWSAELWPGRIGLIVSQDGGGRRIAASPWGLRFPSHPAPERATLWFRELLAEDEAWHTPARRCLILLDSFALPDRSPEAGGSEPRPATRCWYGFDERPLFAWAGISNSSHGPPGFAGLVVSAAAPVTGRVMPALVAACDYDRWLGGDFIDAAPIVQQSRRHPDLYRHVTEQGWNEN